MNYFGFREFLWDVLPEAREHILTAELYECGGRAEDGEVSGTYRLMSFAFQQVLNDAAERGDIPLARRCIDLLEQMLVHGDQDLSDAAYIRMIERYRSDAVTDLYGIYAGPVTREMLADISRDPMYRTAGEPPLPPVPVTDGRPDANAWEMRTWLWDRMPAARGSILIAERAEVQATMSLAAMTPERYVSEGIVHGMLPDLESYSYDHTDQEMVEQATDGLESMLADPVVAALLRAHTAEIIAEFGRNEHLRRYAGPRLRDLVG
ncbi:DUF7674 family protein [Actinoplanes utahensis]|uniref:DUF7674 domain-containing protein n=1 Tax=Actinoplanes utahensis TaxID=1869 RepID=A0A0A6UCK5_ACTUT|nr:hypothetical protein [Actinoplanes utahensis]KHD72019.1 hypothetical protein MB27_42680 [Actinoplanes utahensis]GIF31625.1 hypothetical protein Aut01nite_46110 [Actinoplanes utahensis]